uniref:Vezatin n=1 Tax=Rodentolepis nana TaxID=102285 RepID=A0A0R3TA35_RODNA
LVDASHSNRTRCERMGEFVRTATKAVELHIALVRLETLNSSLVELSQSVDLMVEQEFANVSTGATSLINAFINPLYGRLPASVNKTKMSSVRGICEGLRQGLSLVSRTNTLLSSEFHDLVPIPRNSQKLSLIVISVLIAASHIVNSGLLLLSQSDLTRYTHAELWEITRGIEELSMLTERVQEQLDEKKQLHLRQLLLNGRLFASTSKQLEQKLSELSLLTDPIDSLRPASVGHIIYLLARYRSTTLATFHVLDLLKALRSSSGIIDFLNEVVRKEYEFCSNFLDVMTQSTELLRNLKKVQESVDGHPKSILHKTDLVSSVQRLNLKAHRKPVCIAKTVSIDKFISTFPERTSKRVTATTPIEEGDEEGGEKLQKKIVQWSDYYEVTLRHQVVGRYLQLTWIGLSEEFDSLLQLIVPTDLNIPAKILPPWPLLNKQELHQLTCRLQELETQGLPEKWIIEEDNCDVFRTPICGFLRDLLSEILNIKSAEIDNWLNKIPSDARKCFDRLGLDNSTILQTEFSHRLFRIHLDHFLRLLNKFTIRVLTKYQQLLTESQITANSAERITQLALNSSLNFAFCLSFLDLLHFAIDYFCNAQHTIALSHGKYWKNFAIKQSTNQSTRALSTPGPNAAEINEFCSIILAALKVFSRCRGFGTNGIEELEQDESDRIDFLHQGAYTRISQPIIDTALVCLETRFIKTT